MIKLVEAEDIDRKKWDRCIEQSEQAVKLFNYSWYLDVICDRWNAIIKGDYEAVMPLPVKKRLGSKYIYQPFFSRELNVYCTLTDKASQTELIKEFLEYVPSNYGFIQFGFEDSFKEKTEDLFNQFEIERFPYQQLGLNSEHSTILSAYSQNAKRSVKKAKKQGFELKELTDYKQIVDLFHSTKGDQVGVFSEADYERLVQLMIACNLNGKGKGWGIYSQSGVLKACGFFMEDTDRIIYLKGASDEEGKKFGAMYMLFDEVVQIHCNKEMTLDFGGSKVESIANFFKKFGATDCFYLFLTRNQLPAWVKFLKKSKEMFIQSN